MCSNAGVKPACVVAVAHEDVMLNHVSGVVHRGADFAPDLDLLQGNHHGSDGALTRLGLGKQVPKLHRTAADWTQLVRPNTVAQLAPHSSRLFSVSAAQCSCSPCTCEANTPVSHIKASRLEASNRNRLLLPRPPSAQGSSLFGLEQ